MSYADTMNHMDDIIRAKESAKAECIDIVNEEITSLTTALDKQQRDFQERYPGQRLGQPRRGIVHALQEIKIRIEDEVYTTP